MAVNTNLTRLNLHFEEIYKSFIDKRLGLKISMGLISGLRVGYRIYQQRNQGFALCLQEQGMPQDELDRLCMKLLEQAQSLGFDVLCAKSDLPFDNRWYIMGDRRTMLEAGQNGRMDMPFSNFLYTNVIVELEDYETNDEESP